MARRKRQDNPLPEFIVGCVVGSALVLGSVGGEADQEVYEFETANGGIVLFTPVDVIERTINSATGKGGYSHIGMLLGLTNDSKQVLIVDSQPGRGVKAIPLKNYHGRRITYIPLDDRTLAHARGAALSRVGKPYRGRQGGLTCGEFIYACMPRKYQAQMKEKGNFPTPNSIAKAFGIEPGGQETIGDLARRLKF